MNFIWMRIQVIMVLISQTLWQLLKAKGKSHKRDRKHGTILLSMIHEIDASVIIVVMIMLVRIDMRLKLGLVRYKIISWVVLIN